MTNHERHDVLDADGRLLASCTTRDAQMAAVRLLSPGRDRLRMYSTDRLMGAVAYELQFATGRSADGSASQPPRGTR